MNNENKNNSVHESRVLLVILSIFQSLPWMLMFTTQYSIHVRKLLQLFQVTSHAVYNFSACKHW